MNIDNINPDLYNKINQFIFYWVARIKSNTIADSQILLNLNYSHNSIIQSAYELLKISNLEHASIKTDH